MAFYIKPPEGTVSLASLEKFGRKRLSFLKEVLRCDGSESFRRLVSETDTTIDSECLIEGSKKDRTSHFLLRLVCCEDNEMLNFLLQAETELFGYRFSSMDTQELFHLLQSTHRFVRKCLNFKTCANNDDICNLHMALDMIYSSTNSWLLIIEKYMDDCCTETFHIPFQLSLSLVAGRQVELKNGLASVPFSKLHVVLSSLFHTMLKDGLRKAAMVCDKLSVGDREDKLVQNLKLFCQTILGSPHFMRSVPCRSLSCNQIDEEVAFFPPCMKHLHGVLRQRHRLRHHSRVQYTLYQKEIGLPLDEALVFWKREYSLPQMDRSGSSVMCCHTWQKDHKRYIYNIRHMYGLEGSRTNYSAHSCKFLQMYIPGPGEEGGCPFSQADSSHLRTFMDIEEVDKLCQETILSLRKNRQYAEACRKFFLSKVNHKLRSFLSTFGSKGEWCSQDVTEEETHSGDVSDAEVSQCGEPIMECVRCRQFEATGRMLESDIRLGGTRCQCSEETVSKGSRTIEYNSGDFAKITCTCACNNTKVNMLQSSRSFRSETTCKGKCAISSRDSNVFKRKKVSHDSHDGETQNMDPKDSGYESVNDCLLSVKKETSVKKIGKITERMEKTNESRFVDNITRKNGGHVNMRKRGGYALEKELTMSSLTTWAEIDGQKIQMGTDEERNQREDVVIHHRALSFGGRDSDLHISNPGSFNTSQYVREVSVSTPSTNLCGKTDSGNGKPVVLNHGAIQQLYQTVRNQDIGKPSDFYTSFRKFISELKSL